MRSFCTYHPEKPAAWECESCRVAFCDACADKRPGEGSRCPKCGEPVSWLGTSNLLDPYWNRLPGIVTYPFFPTPVLLNVFLAGLLLFLHYKGFADPWVKASLLGTWFVYALSAFNRTSSGELHPPEVSLTASFRDFRLLAGQVLMFGCLAAAFHAAVRTFGLGVGILFAVMVFVYLPAMLMRLSSARHLMDALSPLGLLRVPVTLGGAYLLMIGLLAFPAGALLLFRQSPALPLPFHQGIDFFLLNTYALMALHFTGYVLLQYRERIGARPAYDELSSRAWFKKQADPAAGPLARKVDVLIREQKYDAAVSRLETATRTYGVKDLDIMDRYLQLMGLTGRTAQMLDYGRTHVTRLIAEGKKEAACNAYRLCSEKDRQFAPPAGDLMKLAGWLKTSGYPKEAVRAYAAFARVYRGDGQAAVAVFRAAEILNETFGRKNKAAKLLKGLVVQYPDHDLIPFFLNYLQQIRQQSPPVAARSQKPRPAPDHSPP